MNNFLKGLLLFCVFLTTTNCGFSEEEEVFHEHTPQSEVNHDEAQVSSEMLPESKETIDGRSIKDTVEKSDNFDKQSKPLRSIFLGIYKNYKSTYLGNKTLTEYKQSLRENIKNKQQQEQLSTFENENDDDDNDDGDDGDVDDGDDGDDDDGVVTEYFTTTEAAAIETKTFTTISPSAKQELKAKQKRKNKDNVSKETIQQNPLQKAQSKVQKYNVGPALNLSLDLANSIVKVNLDTESFRELVTGRWLNDNTEDGRGKKYEMVTRILPLFILPFLIQSAIVPFLVTKLKLLLMKSMLVGKLAIFLLIISAFRNSNKQMQTYEVAPSYWAGEPSRRSELAAAASNMAYNGYRVEGKPAAWIN